jgi:hypothetical protein
MILLVVFCMYILFTHFCFSSKPLSHSPLTMVRSTVAKAKTTKKLSVERHRSTRAPTGLPKNPVVDSNKAEFAVVSYPAVPAPPPLSPVVLSTCHPRPQPPVDSSEEESIDLETSQNRYVLAVVSNLIFCPHSSSKRKRHSSTFNPTALQRVFVCWYTHGLLTSL